ncbi:MAG: signal peptidase I [Hyphomicrobiales bacterium]
MSDKNFKASERISPFLLAPFYPRKTIRKVANSTSITTILLLFSVVGFTHFLQRMVDFKNGGWQDLSELLPVVSLVTILGVLGMCFTALVTASAGRIFGGNASNRKIFTAFAWGTTPVMWIAPIVAATLYLISQERREVIFLPINEVTALSINIVFLCTSFWSLIITIIMIMDLERFGITRTIATYFSAFLVVSLLMTVSVRAFLWQPFNIPAGSQMPTLLIGDHIFVSKYAYGYSRFSFPFSPALFEGRVFGNEPKRGDVVVFRLPHDNSQDYIKRVIGLPGDEIEIRGGQLLINGKAVQRRRLEDYILKGKNGLRNIPQYEEVLPNQVFYRVLETKQNSRWDNVGPYKVPADHYFFLGDNRDNSNDSRGTVGMVPFENLVGRAEIIFMSVSPDGSSRSGRILTLIR